jgi:signal transduction histidine kinase
VFVTISCTQRSTHCARVGRDGDDVTVEAYDDGRGAECVRAGQGLSGMRCRLEEMGGLLEIAAAPERPFKVSARLPLRRGMAS